MRTGPAPSDIPPDRAVVDLSAGDAVSLYQANDTGAAPLAVRVSGPLISAFPDGAPPPDLPDDPIYAELAGLMGSSDSGSDGDSCSSDGGRSNEKQEAMHTPSDLLDSLPAENNEGTQVPKPAPTSGPSASGDAFAMLSGLLDGTAASTDESDEEDVEAQHQKQAATSEAIVAPAVDSEESTKAEQEEGVVEIEVPEGTRGGDTITLEISDGVETDIEIPSGLEPGDTFEVDITDFTDSSPPPDKLGHDGTLDDSSRRSTDTGGAQAGEDEAAPAPTPTPVRASDDDPFAALSGLLEDV